MAVDKQFYLLLQGVMRIPHITLLLATVCLVTGSDSHKRAPSGFTGVRGKKSITDSEYANVEYPTEKRVSAGFFGDQQKPFDGWAEKRVPASGFLGVRGKKDSESRSSLINHYNFINL